MTIREEMTDRDFKLLVREYVDLIEDYEFYNRIDPDQYAKRMAAVKAKLKKELERFTKEEIESLPFKD